MGLESSGNPQTGMSALRALDSYVFADSPTNPMQKTTWTASLIAAGLLAFGGIGCKKQEQPQPPLESSIQRLRAALVKASPEVQSNFYNGVDYNVRYENYVQAMMFVDRIANDPSLNPQQKKLANEAIEQLKARIQEKQQNKP